MMKIYRYILLTFLSTLFASCMQPFDLKLDDDPVIFLEAFPGVEDMVVFKIVPAYSNSNSAIKPEFKPEITFLVNGEQMPVVLNKDYCMSVKYENTYYVADYKPAPGDKMSVEVASEGFETIYAETTIPDGFPDWKIDYREVRAGESTYHAVYVSFKDDESSDLSYGLQVHNERLYTYPDGSTESITRRSTGFQLVDDFDISPYSYNGMTFSFNGWTLDGYSYDISGWDDDTYNGKDMNLSMALYGGYGDLFGYEKEDVERYDEYGEFLGLCNFKERNRLVLYTMSSEFYKYVIAREMISENSDFIAGLAPSNFCYSNITNGAGVFAGVYCVETDWITKELIESDR